MTDFTLIFALALLMNLGFTYRSSDHYKKRNKNANDSSSGEVEDEATNEKWKGLLRKYLSVYLLGVLSDWLQGPYVYALYAKYKYTQHDIAVLFVAGFGSSMVFGSFIGGMADWGGRRLFIVLFAAIYGASCMTKHFKSFWILMLGRLLGGVATSLLFSVFEAWLIRSHADAGLKSYLGKSFSWAAYGNSIVAIFAGLLANRAAGDGESMSMVADGFYMGGCLNPFDIALCALIVCGFLAATTWEENFGEAGNTSSDSGRSSNWHDGLKNAFQTTIRSTDILLCGIISSLFEGSMYVFVFMWTPALTKNDSSVQLPFGVIFSTFMVCCMAGSSVYSILSDGRKSEQLGVGLFATSAIAMFLVATSSSSTMKFIAMNLFEMTVGMYWPVMGTMKGMIVPESMRAAIYNLYRIPLNFIVLFSLLTDLTPTQSFSLNFIMLSTATGLQYVLMKRREKTGMTHSSGVLLTKESESGARNDDDEPLLEKAHVEAV